MLDIPEPQATQFHLEYFRLTGQDELTSLFARTKGKLSSLLKLFDELARNRGMSIEQIANVVEISLHKLPNMESLYDQSPPKERISGRRKKTKKNVGTS
jgi:hypothetical protein